METKTELMQIIVVDDIPALTTMIEAILEHSGLTNYCSFNDPIEALEYVKNNEEISLIITDFQMPEMNGIELLKKAKEIKKQIHGIIFSSDPEQVKSSSQDYEVIEKGNNAIERLLASINKVFKIQ